MVWVVGVKKTGTAMRDTRLCVAAHRGVLREHLFLALRNDVLEGCQENRERRAKVSLGTILLIILVLALLGVFPTWPHSREWGYAPSGGVGLVLVIVLILILLGRI